MIKKGAIRLMRNRKIEVSLILILIFSLLFCFIFNEWFGIISYLIFLMVNMSIVISKFDESIIECNKLTTVVLSDRGTIIRFLIFTLLFFCVTFYFINVSINKIIILFACGVIITFVVSGNISKHYKRKLYIPYL